MALPVTKENCMNVYFHYIISSLDVLGKYKNGLTEEDGTSNNCKWKYLKPYFPGKLYALEIILYEFTKTDSKKHCTSKHLYLFFDKMLNNR